MPGYHLPYFTAAAIGLYEEHGLEVEIVDPEPGIENVRAVARGAYDACLTSVAYFLRAKGDDPDLPAKFVFMVARRTHMAAFCVEGRRTARGRLPETLADLEGATVLGAAESPFVREYLGALGELGIAPGPLVELPYGEVMDALALGRGDVAADYLDLVPAFETAAAAHDVRVRALPFYRAGLDVYGSGLVVGTALLESRRDAVVRLVRAVRAALTATRRRPQIGLPLLTSRFPDADERRALDGWRAGEALIFGDDGDASALGTMDAATWRRTIAYHAVTHGTARLPVGDAFDASFVE
jgi:NitT/TauT family transport system substrate-binding protein